LVGGKSAVAVKKSAWRGGGRVGGETIGERVEKEKREPPFGEEVTDI